MIKNFDQIIHRIKFSNFPTIIAVAGGSASGKTTEVSEILKVKLIDMGFSCEILSQDNFQVGKKLIKKFSENMPLSEEDRELEGKIKKYKWDLLENFNLTYCKEKLLEIRSRKSTAQIPLFDIKNSESVSNNFLEFKVPQVIIWEGIYSFYGELNDFNFDFKVFIDSDFSSRILKRYFRSAKQFETLKVDSILHNIFIPVSNAYDDFVLQQKESADIVLFNEYDFSYTIKKFSLLPVSDINLDLKNIEYEISFQENGKILFYKNENRYYFAIKFENIFYENVEISESVFLEILRSRK